MGSTEIDQTNSNNEDDDEQPTSLPLWIDLNQDNETPTTTRESPDGDATTSAVLRDRFERDGFVRIDQPILSPRYIEALHLRLENVLRGRYSTGVPPKKAPRIFRTEYRGCGSAGGVPPSLLLPNDDDQRRRRRGLVGPLNFQPGKKNKPPANTRVLQVINVFKADTLFRYVALHPALGRCVASIAGWSDDGVRLGSDQVWAKPPGAGPLAWHRDGPYFMFAPADVVTVWVALDEMDDPTLGPLRYVRGSHVWKDDDTIGAYEGFLGDGVLQQDDEEKVDIVSMLGLQAGALSIHHGRTWHGSTANTSRNRPRRGFGIHYVPANVRFTKEAAYSKLWRPYVQDAIASNEDPASIPLPEEDFPLVWSPES